MFSHASGSQRETSDVIFTSKKLDKSEELVNAINHLKINYARYELKKASFVYARSGLTSDTNTVTHTRNRPDTVTHTSNGILD